MSIAAFDSLWLKFINCSTNYTWPTKHAATPHNYRQQRAVEFTTAHS